MSESDFLKLQTGEKFVQQEACKLLKHDNKKWNLLCSRCVVLLTKLSRSIFTKDSNFLRIFEVSEKFSNQGKTNGSKTDNFLSITIDGKLKYGLQFFDSANVQKFIKTLMKMTDKEKSNNLTLNIRIFPKTSNPKEVVEVELKTGFKLYHEPPMTPEQQEYYNTLLIRLTSKLTPKTEDEKEIIKGLVLKQTKQTIPDTVVESPPVVPPRYTASLNLNEDISKKAKTFPKTTNPEEIVEREVVKHWNAILPDVAIEGAPVLPPRSESRISNTAEGTQQSIIQNRSYSCATDPEIQKSPQMSQSTYKPTKSPVRPAPLPSIECPPKPIWFQEPSEGLVPTAPPLSPNASPPPSPMPRHTPTPLPRSSPNLVVEESPLPSELTSPVPSPIPPSTVDFELWNSAMKNFDAEIGHATQEGSETGLVPAQSELNLQTNEWPEVHFAKNPMKFQKPKKATKKLCKSEPDLRFVEVAADEKIDDGSKNSEIVSKQPHELISDGLPPIEKEQIGSKLENQYFELHDFKSGRTSGASNQIDKSFSDADSTKCVKIKKVESVEVTTQTDESEGSERNEQGNVSPVTMDVDKQISKSLDEGISCDIDEKDGGTSAVSELFMNRVFAKRREICDLAALKDESKEIE